MAEKREVDAQGLELTFKLKNLQDVHTLLSELDHYHEQYVIDDAAYFDLKLCVEELLLNVFNHGYKAVSRAPAVAVSIRVTPHLLSAEIIDNAAPFDLFHSDHKADLTSGLEDRPIGGLGIHLVKGLSDELEYSALKNGNRVYVGKNTGV